VGLTACVPPVAGQVIAAAIRAGHNVTALAFVAATVNMEELPALIEAGLAAMLTVGIAVEVELLKLAPPHPANTRKSGNRNTIANGEEIQLRDRWAHAFITVFSL
jgi:hypothetical protein